MTAAAQAKRRAGSGTSASVLTATPLLLLPVLAYNLIALTGFGGGAGAFEGDARLGGPLFNVAMASGARWPISLGDLLIAVSLLVLFVELLKSTTSRRTVIVNHALSMVLFIVCLVQFLLLPAFGTSTFFLILLMVLLDVLAGFIVTIVASRRDFDMSGE
jgi:hypothetical protein